jgi:hypothetical protein
LNKNPQQVEAAQRFASKKLKNINQKKRKKLSSKSLPSRK